MKQYCKIIISLLIVFPMVTNGNIPPEQGTADLNLARRLENAFVSVAEQTSESVVIITSKMKVQDESSDTKSQDPLNPHRGTPFEFFFRDQGIPHSAPQETDSQGSGVIIRADGYILTNNHVVDQANKIKVRLKDGRDFDGTVIGFDERTDIAVIKIEASDLPTAALGDSDKVRVGQWAIAIGAPYELDYSFTVGFVSAKGRSAVWGRAESAYEDYIQTDAAINPGNSGGPLCDIEGRVIGINTLIRGLNRGIGFAIPINMAGEIAEQLIDKGKVSRPWIGVQIESLAENKELLESLKDQKIKEGVVVRAIYPDTPAATSKLEPADIIVNADGTPVASPRDLQKEILKKQIGEKVTLDVIRDGKPISLLLTTGELPSRTQLVSKEATPSVEKVTTLGLSVQTLTNQIAEQLNLKNTKGVIVTDVSEGSPAAEKGLQRGDLITEVNHLLISDSTEFEAAMKSSDLQKGVLLYVKRNGTSTFVVLKASD